MVHGGKTRYYVCQENQRSRNIGFDESFNVFLFLFRDRDHGFIKINFGILIRSNIKKSDKFEDLAWKDT